MSTDTAWRVLFKAGPSTIRNEASSAVVQQQAVPPVACAFDPANESQHLVTEKAGK